VRPDGTGLVAGVLTGAASRADLEGAGAPVILDTIGDLPSRLELDGSGPGGGPAGDPAPE
jgi:hypothetical protein